MINFFGAPWQQAMSGFNNPFFGGGGAMANMGMAQQPLEAPVTLPQQASPVAQQQIPSMMPQPNLASGQGVQGWQQLASGLNPAMLMPPQSQGTPALAAQPQRRFGWLARQAGLGDNATAEQRRLAPMLGFIRGWGS